MKSIPLLVYIVVLATLVFISGCLNQNTLNLGNVQARFTEAFSKLNTYSFTTTITNSLITINSSGNITNTSTNKVHGIVDKTQDRYYQNMNSTFSSVNYNYTDYCIDHILYRNVKVTNVSVWVKENISDLEGFLFRDLEREVTLQNYSAMTALHEETIDAVPCYIVRTTVDVRRYYDATFGSAVDSQRRNESINDLVNLTKEWTVTFWISKSDFQLQQMDQRTVLEFNSTTHAQSIEETSTRFYGYNNSVSIILPSESETASWIEHARLSYKNPFS